MYGIREGRKTRDGSGTQKTVWNDNNYPSGKTAEVVRCLPPHLSCIPFPPPKIIHISFRSMPHFLLCSASLPPSAPLPHTLLNPHYVFANGTTTCLQQHLTKILYSQPLNHKLPLISISILPNIPLFLFLTSRLPVKHPKTIECTDILTGFYPSPLFYAPSGTLIVCASRC